VNVQILIDSIVRQTTVLVAQLATSGGARAQLAHVANQVFLDLADELHRQGVGRKVSADMFGLALRTYLRKIRRLSESATDRGGSLWNAVLEFLGNTGKIATRGEVLARFHQDDPELVAGVLHDLCESGLVFRVGAGPLSAYRAATREELGALSQAGASEGLDLVVWALVYREGPLTHDALEKAARATDLDRVLSGLVEDGRVRKGTSDSGETTYFADEFFVPIGAPAGWEAAVFDHFQAVVKTICRKLTSEPDRTLGGSTYSFEVWSGHPLEAEVLGQLERLRATASDLRGRVLGYNESHARPRDVLHVTFYGGQSSIVSSGDAEVAHVGE
jgi:hypothetical protein